MILKSFEIEKNIQKIHQYKFILIYGENIGLKEALAHYRVHDQHISKDLNICREDLD